MARVQRVRLPQPALLLRHLRHRLPRGGSSAGTPTLDALNEAWGTAFWSQRYTAWDDILPPRRTPSFNNPTQVLDYHRFGSDTLLDFYRAEHEVIRRHSPTCRSPRTS